MLTVPPANNIWIYDTLEKITGIEDDFTKHFENICWLNVLINITPTSFIFILLPAGFYQNCQAAVSIKGLKNQE